MSDLAGQLMVRGSEARILTLDARDKAAFLDLPWVEAIEEFKARGILKPTELSTLLKDYAQRSDKARQLMLEQVQVFVRSELERSLKAGGTFKEFSAAIDSGAVSLGITNDDPAYLNMVFRTNVQSAYGAGRYRAMTDPDVADARPYVEYRTVGDARVRDSHAVLDKTVYALASDTWKRICPPNSYNCRCAMVTLTREEASGRDILDDVPTAFVPTAGFNSAPLAKLNAPTPKLAPALQQKPLPVILPTPEPANDVVAPVKPDAPAAGNRTPEEERARQERMRKRAEALAQAKKNDAKREEERQAIDDAYKKAKPVAPKKVEPKMLEAVVARALKKTNDDPDSAQSVKALIKVRSSVKSQLNQALPGIKRRRFFDEDGNEIGNLRTKILMVEDQSAVADAHADWDGSVRVGRDVYEKAKVGDRDAIATLVHEELHQHGPLTFTSIAAKRGRAVEEVATEVLTRHIAGVDYGAYDDEIDMVKTAIAQVTRGHLSPDEIDERLLNAAVYYRKQKETDDADQLVSYLVDGLGLPASMRGAMLAALKKLSV